MKNKVLKTCFLVFFFNFSCHIFAQILYVDDVYADVKITQNVKYGSNVPYSASTPIDLLLDIYEPNGDLNPYRPLIIFMHAGNFLPTQMQSVPGLGSKEDSAIIYLCRKFAQKGYVAVSMDYRVGWNPTAGTSDERAKTYLSAIWRAQQDAKACIRYFRAHALDYRINPNQIILGGSEAGSVVALHVAHLNKPVELAYPRMLDDSNIPQIDTVTLGGFEGNSGNSGFNSKPNLTLNFGGAVADTNFIENGEIPMISFHGYIDDMPYYNSVLIFNPIAQPIMEVFGSWTFTRRAKNVGILDCFSPEFANDNPFPAFRPFYGKGFEPFGIYGNSTSQEISTAETYLDTIQQFCIPRLLKALNIQSKGVSGYIYNDLNQNGNQEVTEPLYQNEATILIQPGNYIIQTHNGFWHTFQLPAGNYTATLDTTGNWKTKTANPISFYVPNPDSLVTTPTFGMYNVNPCIEPEIELHMPFIRRCFSNQMIYLKACNKPTASETMYNAYSDVTLDTLLQVNGSSLPYQYIGNQTYRFQLGTILPSECKYWSINTTVSCSTTQLQTLCMEAKLFPTSPCVFDTSITYRQSLTNFHPDVPCTTSYDGSNMLISGTCDGDSVRFNIQNIGNPMTCFQNVRIYADNDLIYNAHVLFSNFKKFNFKGLNKTWICEIDQHLLFPGNSFAYAQVEACGPDKFQSSQWIPGIVSGYPLPDQEPTNDIFCGQVTGSFDPNDKTGYPTGIDSTHDILPNQQLQYVIRFQNTGTDTAFTVVIRDTLDTDLNIFSVSSGVSSHNYKFRMYGPRVLEWTFDNILLPDSFRSEPNSHGFITYTVEQNENLPNGTLIENKAAIYFDFNDPVITNIAFHEINRERFLTPVAVENLVQKFDIQVYPNPTDDKITVISNIPSQVELFDFTGRLLQNLNLKQKSHEFNLSNLPAGMYVLKVDVNGKTESRKVVKR